VRITKMAKKKAQLNTEIEKLIELGKAIIGSNETLKAIRKGKVKKVYISSNCSEDVKNDVKHYTKLSGVELIELDKTNEELGILARKPFFVSVLGVKKDD
jgi:large subunit ribosomal protein L30e